MQDRFFDGNRSDTDAAAMYLRVANVECSPNDAHPSLNFLTAVLALVTGIHNRNDLSAATRPLFRQDSEIHNAEACILLHRINLRFPALAKIPFDATGVSQGQEDALAERMKHLLALIDKRHGVNINLSILHVETGRKKKNGTQEKLLKAQAWQSTDQQIERTGYLLHDKELNRFMPMRTMGQLTNPYLSSDMRYRNKSFLGKARAVLADVRSELGSAARVDAFQLDDAELYERAIDGRTGKVKIKGAINAENEYIKEWNKRTDAAYSQKKPLPRSTILFQKLRSVLPFTSKNEPTNPFLNLSNAEIDLRLNAPDSKASGKEKAFLKETRRLNFLKTKAPEILNPLPPTPLAFAPVALFEDVFRDFDALLQPNGELRINLHTKDLSTELRTSLQQARVAVIEALMTGDKNFLKPALSYFHRPIPDPVNALAGTDALYERLRKLRRSVLALGKGSRPLAHERPAEIADALRACDFSEADVKKFFETSARVMETRREALKHLRGCLPGIVEQPERMRALIKAAPDEKVVKYAKYIIARRGKKLRATLREKAELDKNIADRERLIVPSADDSSTEAAIIREVHAHAGTDEFKAQTLKMSADSKNLETKINALEIALGQTRAAEKRIAKLEKSAIVWSEINTVWEKCDGLSESMLAVEMHASLVSITRRQLLRPVGNIVEVSDAGREV